MKKYLLLLTCVIAIIFLISYISPSLINLFDSQSSSFNVTFNVSSNNVSSFETSNDGWNIDGSGVWRNNSWASVGNWNLGFFTFQTQHVWKYVTMDGLSTLSVDYNSSNHNEGVNLRICNSCTSGGSYTGCVDLANEICESGVGTKIYNISGYTGIKCLVFGNNNLCGFNATFNYTLLDNIEISSFPKKISYNITIPNNANVTTAYFNLSQFNFSDGIPDSAQDMSGFTAINVDCSNVSNSQHNYTRQAMKKFVCGNVSSLGRYATWFNTTSCSGIPIGNYSIRIRDMNDTILMQQDMGLVSSLPYTSFSPNYVQANFSKSRYICEDVYLSLEIDDNNGGQLRTYWVITSDTSSNYHGYYYDNNSQTWINDFVTNHYPGYNIIYTPSSPTNPYILFNNSNIWNYTGTFNIINSRTNDFSSKLNSAINNGLCNCVNCTLSGNNCIVPFSFSSDIFGVIGVNDLNITYTSSSISNISFKVNSPSGTFNSPTNVPININVSVLGLSNISYCFYNVTYSNLTLAVNNTHIINTTNAYLSVPDYGSYTFNIQCNDTSGVTNRTSSNFSVVNNPGGGGGGYTATSYNQSSNIGVTIPNAGNWTMSTTGFTNYYELQMTSSSSRTESILFQNLGTSTRPLTLSCQDVNGSICKYVKFPSSFDLPVLRDIKTSKDTTISLPSTIPKGNYAFNIYAKDDLGNSQVVTFVVSVGNFGFITNALIKAGSSLNINGVNIPYLIIAIFAGVILFILSYFILRKKSYGSSVSFLIGILTAILTLILI